MKKIQVDLPVSFHILDAAVSFNQGRLVHQVPHLRSIGRHEVLPAMAEYRFSIKEYGAGATFQITIRKKGDELTELVSEGWLYVAAPRAEDPEGEAYLMQLMQRLAATRAAFLDLLIDALRQDGIKVEPPERGLEQPASNLPEHDDVAADAVRPAGRKTQPAPLAQDQGDASERYLLRKKGEFWEVAFKAGGKFHLGDLKGLDLLAILLGQPNRPIKVLRLEQVYLGHVAGTAASTLAEDELRVTENKGHGGTQVDGKTIVDCHKRLKQIKEEKAEAEVARDETKLSALDKEEEDIQKYLRNSRGLGGKARPFRGETKRGQERVQKAIRAAIDRIKENDPICAEYLSKQIETGFDCVYRCRPDELIDWDISR